ncbi:dTDP-4-dehydrorhamnose 3,5-epimerase [Salinarimonas ramus]|uniref:dTDP-4-dehydrorhamnose 3,5-epimerase n=1 Tax=Salinarimonas ramus TaxID=690164 RepID=A0A917V349_9HYPH|nr:dTDP-4-dehydrorhamnose 3,5-epimerase [Salinarimonas ramus]GGK29271.1 dTDP-4-dehydrorhamnose 3,5-epimerase [Salinarimonas ramus]
MRFSETPLAGAFLIEPEPIADPRGFFARTVDREAFAAHGLDADFVQASVSFNARAGTLRGLHFQRAPHAEDKLVRVTAGAILDVIVDMRPRSPTRWRWHAQPLDAASRAALYVPKGFAHGFVTLVDETEILYQMTTPYVPGAGAGLRWDDPMLAIEWPIRTPILSESDEAWPLLVPGAFDDEDAFP